MEKSSPGHRHMTGGAWTLGLLALGILMRLPFVSHVLYHWDSINYALALEEYSIAMHQPQPPGYILYVLLTRAVNWFVGNPQWTFVGINVVCSTVAALALYYLGRAMFNPHVGMAACLLLLFSPLFWFYSEIALPNVIDGLIVTLIAWLLYEVSQGKDRYILPASTVLGIAGGFRQQTLVFMAPLAVYAMRKTKFWQMALAAGWAGVLFLGSFVPMVRLTGGLQQYRATVSGLSASFFTETSVFMGGGSSGLVRNVVKLSSFTLYSLSLAVVPLGIWMIWKVKKVPTILKDETVWFLALWILPSLAFYTLIHMGGHGLVFAFLPAVVLIAAKALVDLVDIVREPWRKRSFFGFLGIILIVDIVLFTAVSNHPIAGADLKIVNWQTIKENDRYFDVRFDLIKDTFDPAHTVIFAGTWRHAQYYMPEYYVLSMPTGLSGYSSTPTRWSAVHGGELGVITDKDWTAFLPDQVRHIVFFDEPSSQVLSAMSEERLRELSAQGEYLYYVQLEEDEVLDHTDGQLKITGE
jgi:hypothetical protein